MKRICCLAWGALAALPGCSSSQHATGDTTFTARAGGADVEVRLDDYVIHMPTTIPPGHAVFHVHNDGSHRHTIVIRGEGVDARLTPDLASGQSGDLALDLAPGTYRVTCPIGPHAALGMRLTLTVAAVP